MGDPVQISIFRTNHTTKMAATGSSCLWHIPKFFSETI
jgi:hypothetical protein